jgi:hypothetical protein
VTVSKALAGASYSMKSDGFGGSRDNPFRLRICSTTL